MIGDTQQRLDGDFQADLFEGFADGARLKRFEEIDLTPNDAPASGFRRRFSQRQENAARFVDEKDACSHSGMGVGIYRCGCGAHRSRLDTHLDSAGSGATISSEISCSTVSSTTTISLWAGDMNPSATL